MSDWNGHGQPQGGYPPQGGHPPQGGYPPHGYPPQGYPLQGGVPPVKRVSIALYVVLPLVSMLAGAGMTTLAATDSKVQELRMFSWAPMLLSAILSFMLLYKAWAAIQDGHARTTPGNAVGYLFIPFFNIYWVFIAVGSWGREFNAFADRQRVMGFRASAGLFLAHCIMALIPPLSIVAAFTSVAVLVQYCRGINAVTDRHSPPLPVAVARR